MSDTSAPVTRKRFVRWLLGTSVGGLVAAVLYPVTRYIIPPKVGESAASSVTLPFPPTEIAKNTGRIFKFGNKPGIILRTPNGDLRAFTAVCTHLGCTVQYRSDLSEIWCACHNGTYDLNGRNISGPPPKPLTPFDVRVRGTQIVVSRKA
ncbi:MAG TPA: Rieske (2Fe-2S) protein [Gemmatimonadales bacterium]|jgi:Rieske Fe-S protein|nr:Rieske (2Fe-2S) protein [Gemmatimonadales bacterium]